MHKEPILINGLSVSAAVAATIALLARFDVPVMDGDGPLFTAFISVVVIPIGTWVLARRKTVTVHTANKALASARADNPVAPFEVGS